MQYMAIDLGGTALKGAVVGVKSERAEVLYALPSPVSVNNGGTREEILAAFREITLSLAAWFDRRSLRPDGVCLDTPGPFDYRATASRMTHKYQAINGLPLQPYFSEWAGTPRVHFCHDSTAFLYGELTSPHLAAYRRVAGIMLGTGLGFATAAEGKVLEAPSGGPAVSLWGRPYRGGIAEDCISGRGISSLYGDAAVSPKELQAMAEAGDNRAAAAYTALGRCMAEVLEPVLAEFGCEALTVGGQIARAFPLFATPLRAGLSHVQTLKEIRPATHLQDAHLLGAVIAACKNVQEDHP